MKKINFISVFAVLTVLFSCSTDDNSGTDTQKPTIEILTPTDGDILHTGEEFHVDIDFSDNVALASYKIDIHFAGDGHSHEKSMNDPIEWTYETIGTLSEMEDNIHLDISIPESTKNGEYHFGVYATDKAGNQNVVWIKIDVHNHD